MFESNEDENLIMDFLTDNCFYKLNSHIKLKILYDKLIDFVKASTQPHQLITYKTFKEFLKNKKFILHEISHALHVVDHHCYAEGENFSPNSINVITQKYQNRIINPLNLSISLVPFSKSAGRPANHTISRIINNTIIEHKESVISFSENTTTKSQVVPARETKSKVITKSKSIIVEGKEINSPSNNAVITELIAKVEILSAKVEILSATVETLSTKHFETDRFVSKLISENEILKEKNVFIERQLKELCGDKSCGDKSCGDKSCGDKSCGDKSCGDKSCGKRIMWKRIMWKRIMWKRIMWKRIMWKRIMWKRIMWKFGYRPKINM